MEMKEPPGNFGAGVVCAHLVNTLAYPVYLKDHKDSDVVGMANATGLSNTQIALALTLPGALDAGACMADRCLNGFRNCP
jgi:hypothetical protein